LHREKRSFDIGVEYVVIELFDHFAQRNKASGAGVGEDDIDSPLCLDRLVEPVKVIEFGNVTLNTGNVAADCLDGLVQFLRAAASDEDISPSSTKSFAVASPIP
jgi:hypothetical protein